MAPYRSSQVLAALTLLIILTWLGLSFNRSDDIDSLVQPNHKGKSQNNLVDAKASAAISTSPPTEASILETLCNYGVCHISADIPVTYGRIEMEVVETPSYQRPLLQNVSISIPTLSSITSKDMLKNPVSPGQKARVAIDTRPAPTDASNIIFGVATNIDRLEASLAQFSHWASNNGARIIALLPNTTVSADVDRTLEKSKALKIDLTIDINNMSFDDRYFHLATLMHNYSTPSTTWASFIDDDTFFLSMNTVQAMLSKYSSPQTSSYYIGAISEDFHQLFKWGMMAYGGGGVFVSMGLLNELAPHLPSCAQLAHTGDARLAQCIFLHTMTKLTPEAHLYQVDLWGDATGFYEALRTQPISVHHWKSWHRYDMHNISKVASVCGDSCIFHKYRFDDDYQLTNGFSIVKYSAGYERNGTDQRAEKTWWDSQGGTWDMFLHSVAPLRAKDPQKIQYLLEGCAVEDGVVRQFYVRRSPIGEVPPKVEIIEVAWRKKVGNIV